MRKGKCPTEFRIELRTFQKEYAEVSSQCRLFVATLLDECRATEEVELLLGRKFLGTAGVSYPRLKLAIDKNISEVSDNLSCFCELVNSFVDESFRN